MKMGSVRSETRTPAAGEVLTRSARRAAELLDLTQRDLARVIGVSPATISRLPQRPLDPSAQEGELTILFVSGYVDSARKWLYTENTHLAGVPAQLIQTVTGLVDVVEYLD